MCNKRDFFAKLRRLGRRKICGQWLDWTRSTIEAIRDGRTWFSCWELCIIHRTPDTVIHTRTAEKNCSLVQCNHNCIRSLARIVPGLCWLASDACLAMTVTLIVITPSAELYNMSYLNSIHLVNLKAHITTSVQFYGFPRPTDQPVDHHWKCIGMTEYHS